MIENIGYMFQGYKHTPTATQCVQISTVSSERLTPSVLNRHVCLNAIRLCACVRLDKVCV
jgi:hypothetical protein